MPASFQCPACGAPLDVPLNPGATMRCPFCSNSVIIPRDLRDGEESEWIEMNLASLTGDPDKLTEMRNAMLAGNKIEAIKIFRQLYDVDLAEAKDKIEDLMDGKVVRMYRAQSPSTVSVATFTTNSGSPLQTQRFQEALAAGNKIEAIKIYREMTDMGLKESKDAVELIMANLGGSDSPEKAPIPPSLKSTRQVKRVIFFIVLLTGLVLCLAIGIIFAVASNTAQVINKAAVSVGTEINSPTMLAEIQELVPTQEVSFAPLVMNIGKEGVCGGCFEDLRSVAQAPDGTIFAADYQGGRIQVFDAQGNFTTQWNTGDDGPLHSLAAAQDGSLFVIQIDKLFHYQPDGTLIDIWQFNGDDGFSDVWPLADGGLATFRYTVNGDSIAVFDSQGNPGLFIPDAISGQTGSSELDGHIAADGLGNLYALGTFNNYVLTYSPKGKYVNRFGGDGDQPGQFRAPGDIAVDQQGRIYVSDIKGIQVFDTDGRLLGLIPDQGQVIFGMYVNNQNQLLAAARTQILVFDLPD